MTKNVFDSYRDTYEQTVQASTAFSGLSRNIFLTAKADVLAGIFAAQFGAGARPSLLDIGCGVGSLHPFLRPIAGAISATDSSATSIDRAADDHRDIAYRAGDGRSIPWPTASFDVAIAVCVLHHVPLEERPQFMAEMRRVVRAGGLVVLIEHNPLNPLTQLAVLRCPFDEDAVLLSAGRAKRLLEGCGCVDAESRHFLLFPWRDPLARKIEDLARRWPVGAQYAAVGRVR